MMGGKPLVACRHSFTANVGPVQSPVGALMFDLKARIRTGPAQSKGTQSDTRKQFVAARGQVTDNSKGRKVPVRM